ncbi:MAG: hypothetical protein K0S70_127 [Microbacterium sp.]|jgi:hypothetical protein|nr:hypothetical protein [Microbacterium sp.]
MPTARQLEAFKLWRTAEGKAAVKDGPLPTRRQREQAQIKFAESIAYGDLPTQLQPAIVRTLRAYYREIPQVAERFTTEWELTGIDRDEEYNLYGFNQDNIPGSHEGKQFVPGGLPRVGRRESYPQIGLQASGKKGRVSKTGEAFGIDWETIVNSRGTNVNHLREAIAMFGRHAANQNEIEVASLLVNASGFRTGTGGGLNGATALTGNPDLMDPVELATAIAQLQGVQVEGQDVDYTKFVILTSIPNAPLVRQGIQGRRIVRNPGAQTGYSWEETVDYGAEVEVIGWKWLRTLYPNMGKGAIIVPVAGGDDLPVLTRNRLQGYPEPSFWIKDSNAKSANGGGEINPEAEGDFDSDSVVSKVRHVTGASALWNTAIGFTTGAGS